MYRTETLVIRLSKTEAAIIANLAKAERLPASTLARRLLLLEAERTIKQTSETAGYPNERAQAQFAPVSDNCR